MKTISKNSGVSAQSANAAYQTQLRKTLMKNHSAPYGAAGIILLLVLFMINSAGNALEISGIKMPGSLDAGQTRLLLNGAGVRTKFFISVYVGGLYLQQKSHDPAKISHADEPMAIRLHVISTLITSEKMKIATREGFLKSTHGNLGPLEVQINRFMSVFKDKINKNDFFDLIYVPGTGTEVYKNDKYLSSTEGLAFKRALFGIWLGENPVQKRLKIEMLGMD